jgi:hypothetical protein
MLMDWLELRSMDIPDNQQTQKEDPTGNKALFQSSVGRSLET